jgi:hypothetical protein
MRQSRHGILALAAVAALALAGLARAEDTAAGKVVEAKFGTIKVDENGTQRQFSFSQKTSQFEPDLWRPAADDQVSLTFHTETGKRGTVLVVDKVTLVKAGPNSISSLASPQTVEILESGRSGIRAKLATGQAVKFTLQRGAEVSPAGWVPAAGEKAKLEFKGEKSRVGFGVNFLVSKLEKVQ